jgi:hypothetical protein
MRLRANLLVAAAFCAAIPALAGAQVRVGAIAGYSLLARKDTSGSREWYQEEVTLGRSWLVGGTIDVQFGDSDYLTFDGVYGPYHGDAVRICYERYPNSTPCELQDDITGAGTLAVGVEYLRLFGNRRWRPYLGGGGGHRPGRRHAARLLSHRDTRPDSLSPTVYACRRDVKFCGGGSSASQPTTASDCSLGVGGAVRI